MSYEIRNRNDLEMVGSLIASRFALPENLRLLVIMDHRDFDYLVSEIVIPGGEIEGEHDRFIYTTASGVEFGVKRKYNGEDNHNNSRMG